MPSVTSAQSADYSSLVKISHTKNTKRTKAAVTLIIRAPSAPHASPHPSASTGKDPAVGHSAILTSLQLRDELLHRKPGLFD